MYAVIGDGNTPCTHRTEMINYPEPIPQGFTIQTHDHLTLTIHHKRIGMEMMHAFMVLWLSGWTMGCIALLYIYIQQLQGVPVTNGDPVPLSIVLGFWLGEITVLILLILSVFCEQTFSLDSTELTMQTKLWQWQWQKTIAKGQIQQVVQVQDGGRGRDSFPSWGLHLKLQPNGRTSMTLILRQPYTISYWLGQVLADWAQVAFIPAPQKRLRFGRGR